MIIFLHGKLTKGLGRYMKYRIQLLFKTHTLNVMESFDVGAAGNSLLTTGATTSPSVWPQNWY